MLSYQDYITECTMNCYLPWNLKDMTGIPAEKLQKNIGKQTSYIEMYRSELLKESIRFNIASLLRHVALNRASFGSDEFSALASDCLMVFLHASVFRKVAYFAPTDVENPAVGKCARNLHRLMTENVKSTMRLIDYEVLLRHAQGELDNASMQAERERIHNEVFPQDIVTDVCLDESINNAFFTLIDMETSKAQGFMDFDVRRTTGLDEEICRKLAAQPRRDEKLPQSHYGIIGSCTPYLDTPFIKYSGSYYSFVTRYSLDRVIPAIAEFVVTLPAEEPEPVAEEPEVVEEPEPVEEPVAEVQPEPEAEEEPAPVVEEQEEVIAEPEMTEASEEEEDDIPFEEPEEEHSMFDEDDEIESEEDETASYNEEEDSAYKETDEYEYPDEYEEDTSDQEEMPEDDVYEISEEESSEEPEPVAEPEPAPEPEPEPEAEAEPEPEPEPEPEEESEPEPEPEEQYTALVSPDTYDYLDEAESSEFNSDPLLDEQESGVFSFEDDDDDSPIPAEEDDGPDPYSGESLFSILDESDDEEEELNEVAPADEEPENPVLEQSFPADEEEIPFEEPEDEPEEVPEEEPETEPEEELPPQEEEKSFPLLDQILKSSPSKTNPITVYFGNCNAQQKEEIVKFIEMARKSWLIDGKDKMFTIPDTNISIALFTESQDPMLGIQRRENIGAVMYASGKDTWNSLELSYDAGGQFIKADFVRIGRSSYSDWEWKIVEKLGMRLIERRGK